MKCSKCGFAIRGANHDKGVHHQNYGEIGPKQKELINLNRRITAFASEKVRLEREKGFRGQIRQPGSLQLGKCR